MPTTGTTSPSGRSLFFLLMGTMLFALGAPVLKRLMMSAGELGLRDPVALSFCNVLFVGNLCAGLVTFVVGGGQAVLSEIGGLKRRILVYLGLAALTSTIYPALLYTALERTSVINVVLLSRFNGIVYVAVAFAVLRTMVGRSELLGYIIMASGVVILLLVNNMGSGLRFGDVLVLLATLFFAATEIISKKVLPHCSIVTYVFVRNFVSAIVFLLAGIVLFGAEHFAHAFIGDLWVLMFVYSGLAIVAAQLFWLRAVRDLSVPVIANVQLLNPVFSLIFAFLLLGELPTAGQALVIAVIALGMGVQALGHSSKDRTTMMQLETGLVGR